MFNEYFAKDGGPMGYLILISIALAIAAILWSIESARDFIVRFHLSNEVEDVITITLPSAVLFVLLCIGYLFVKDPSAVSRPPSPPKTAIDPRSKRGPTATTQGISHSAVDVVRGEVRTGDVKLPAATVKVGQDETQTSQDGRFELPLSSVPRAESLVRVTHDGYITRFLRRDDPIITDLRPILLQPKMRLIALERETEGNSIPPETLKRLRSGLEADLKCNEIEILADPDVRDNILRQLAQYQKERALFDPSMVQDIGKFHGATHAVFYRLIKKEGGRWFFEASLVNLATTKVMSTAAESFSTTDELDTVVVSASSRLLADLTAVNILSPKENSHLGRQVEVEGFVAYLPATWKLCLTIVPQNVMAHFPQEQPTINDDGSWFGSEVYLGDSEPLSHRLTFRINAMITRGAQTEVIASYLTSRQSGGIRREALRSGEYRIKSYIDVSRER